MNNSTAAKATAIAILAIAIVPQTAVVPIAEREMLNECFAQSKSVVRSKFVDCGELDEYEQGQIEYLIMQIVNSDMNTIEVDGIMFAYSDLFYNPVEKAGYVIDFSYGEDCGYMLIESCDDSVKPMEITLHNRSPYYGKDGTYLYPSTGNYYIMDYDGSIVPAEQCEVNNRPQKLVQLNSDNKQSVPVDLTYTYHRGEYHEVYEMYKFEYNYNFYNRTKPAGLTNYCANVAGVIALNYWNKHYGNKLLKCPAEYLETYGNNLKEEYALNYLYKFYDYMDTNWLFGMGGTAPKKCYDGFMRFITECGYKAELTIVDSYERMRMCIRSDVPVFITSTDYYFSQCVYTMPDFPLKQDVNTITFNSERSYGVANAHTFIGYGCTQLYLYDKEGRLSTIDLIRVADGWGGARYFHLKESEIISAAGIRVLSLSGC